MASFRLRKELSVLLQSQCLPRLKKKWVYDRLLHHTLPFFAFSIVLGLYKKETTLKARAARKKKKRQEIIQWQYYGLTPHCLHHHKARGHHYAPLPSPVFQVWKKEKLSHDLQTPKDTMSHSEIPAPTWGAGISKGGIHSSHSLTSDEMMKISLQGLT